MGIKFKKSGNDEAVGYIRNLKEENIRDILELHKIIKKGLENSELFYFDDYKFYKDHLLRQGVILGCYVDDMLISYGVMIVPVDDDENLGYDLNLPKGELSSVAHLDSVAVHPDFRGNKLQFTLFNLLRKIAIERGYKHLCSTVSPKNIHSIKNLELLGLEKRLEKLKYGGKNRFIYYSRIN